MIDIYWSGTACFFVLVLYPNRIYLISFYYLYFSSKKTRNQDCFHYHQLLYISEFLIAANFTIWGNRSHNPKAPWLYWGIILFGLSFSVSNIQCNMFYAGSCGTVYHALWYGSVCFFSSSLLVNSHRQNARMCSMLSKLNCVK